jgi:hypothetical protein
MLRDINVEVQLAGGDEYGRVLSGKLMCTGCIKRMENDADFQNWDFSSEGEVHVSNRPFAYGSIVLDVPGLPKAQLCALQVLRMDRVGIAFFLLLHKIGNGNEYHWVGMGHVCTNVKDWFRDTLEESIVIV